GLGKVQARSALYKQMLDKAYMEAGSSSGPIVVTGHSLGGGMAQTFAHDLVKKLDEAGYHDAARRVRTVTFNSFGAMPTLEGLGRFDENIAKHMNVTNYRVVGDPISRIGRDIGERIEVSQLDYFRPSKIHLMNAVESALNKEGALSTTRAPS